MGLPKAPPCLITKRCNLQEIAVSEDWYGCELGPGYLKPASGLCEYDGMNLKRRPFLKHLAKSTEKHNVSWANIQMMLRNCVLCLLRAKEEVRPRIFRIQAKSKAVNGCMFSADPGSRPEGKGK